MIKDAKCCDTCVEQTNLNDSKVYRYCTIHNVWVEITNRCDNHKEREPVIFLRSDPTLVDRVRDKEKEQ